ncbi:ribosome-associated protein [Clostridia bacterium]|nr:ribosome-associated protein [Clostridia bacterium]
MKYKITGRNIDITEGLRNAIEEKLGKLDKFFASDVEVQVKMSVEKNSQKIEVTIPVKGHIIRSEQTSSDMYASLDAAQQVIERQIRKYKSKLLGKKQSLPSFTSSFVDDSAKDEGERGAVVKNKMFGIKPMDVEEACTQMDLLGHNFFVFVNAQTNETNVVYQRRGNSYGLLEPEA